MLRTATCCALLAFCSQAYGDILGGVRFEGGTPFSPQTLLSTYADMLGRPFDGENAVRLEKRLEDLYTDRGYLPPKLDIRPLKPGNPILRVYVWAPEIADLRISGRKHIRSRKNLRQIMSLKSVYPVGAQNFDQALADAARATGLHLTGRLLPDQENDNAFVGKIRVRPRPWEAEFNVDNNGLERFGYEVYEARFAAHHRHLSLRSTWRSAADSDDYRYTNASVAYDLGRSRVSVRAAQSRSALEERSYEYQRESLSGRFAHKLIDHRQRLFRAILGYEQYDIERTFDTGALDESIRAVEIGLNLAFAGNKQLHRFDLRLRSGLEGQGAASDLASTELDFKAVRARYRVRHEIDPLNELELALLGQHSTQVLPAPERFTYGGEAMGGAFEPGSLSGDSGLSGRLSWFRELPSWRRLDSTAFSYVDYGKVWRQPARVGVSSASAGIGVELRTRNVSLKLEYSHAVSTPDTLPEVDDSRLLFTLKSRV